MDDLYEALQRRGDVIGGYVLGDLLGVGGMGVVYAATQRSLDRTVAVKLPRPELASDPAVRRRFRAEAFTSSRVNHRNIVRVVDFGDDNGVPFLVMEHVVGVGLGQLVLEHGRLSVANAIDLVGQILAGLEDAHGNGIVHADVKCDNILVETLRDGTAVPRIIDFGIARFVDDRTPSDGQRMVSGTPEYLAPELVRGERPTFASDVYAVGVILYELISGATPFAGGTSADIMNRQLNDKPTPLSWRCPEGEISTELDELVARALAKRPADRFADAAAFGAALGKLAATTTLSSASPRLPSPGSIIFSTESTTARMSTDAPPRRFAKGSRGAVVIPPEQRRRAVTEAIATGDPDAIVVAYLHLARTRVDAHDVSTAIAELEDGVELLSGPTDGARNVPVWRLMLTLAALYEGKGDRARAQSTTRAAREQAMRIGSAVGCERAENLFLRLVRSPARARRPSSSS